VTRSPRKRGCALNVSYFEGFIPCIMIFNGFSACLGGFNPFLEDLRPFLRPDLGGKLRVCFQLQAYIN
jgi:hypothetical protein